MSNVRELLETKNGDIWSISPQASVLEALKMMAEKDVGALLVIEKDRLVGIFSERDYARKLVLKGKTSKDTPVNELMSKMVYYVKPEAAIEECMALMTERHIRHLPVLENDKVIGIVTIGDVVKQIISKQEFTIKQLENYIAGDYGT